MSLGRSRQTTEQTRTTTPGLGSAPALQNILAAAQGLPGTVVGFSPTAEAGLTGLEQAGQAVGGTIDPAQQFFQGVLGQGDVGGAPGTGLGTLEATARGDLLGANPFIDQLVDVTTSDIIERVNQQAAGAGRLGSTAQQQAIARAVAPAALGLRGQAFESERGRQLAAAQGLLGGGFQAAAGLPAIAQASFLGPEAILRAGLLRDERAQAIADQPFRALQQQASLINPIAQGFASQAGTTTQTQQQSPLQTAIGLGLAGASLASGFGGPAAGAGLFGGGGGFDPIRQFAQFQPGRSFL